MNTQRSFRPRGLALAFVAMGLLTLAAAPASHAAVKPGDAAPAFTLPGAHGGSHSLTDHAGQWVVLEWVNFDCPFVRKHYRSGNMPALQKKWTEEGVIWLSINSSAEGKQGHFEGDALRGRIASEKAAPTAYLLDADGAVGRAYGAQTTPHMFVIDPDGAVVYAGAIDDKPTTRLEDVKTATNHVSAALVAARAGEPVNPAATKAYGCAVKY